MWCFIPGSLFAAPATTGRTERGPVAPGSAFELTIRRAEFNFEAIETHKIDTRTLQGVPNGSL